MTETIIRYFQKHLEFTPLLNNSLYPEILEIRFTIKCLTLSLCLVALTSAKF